MDCVVKFATLCFLVQIVSCTITGLTYMDALNLVPSKPLKGEDPCNPLYWYPRQIPDYCYFPKLDPPSMPSNPPQIPLPPPMPVPMPMYIPLPGPPAVPPPIPGAMPMYVPLPGPPAVPSPIPGAMPIRVPIPAYAPPAPLPLSGYPPYMFPAQELPYPVPAIQSGLVPGVDGLVSADGAINILPFSDAYSDLLEKHKQTLIRRRLQKLLDEYEHYPRKRRCNRKRGCWH